MKKFDFNEEQLIIKPYKDEASIYVRLQKGLYQRIRRYSGIVLMLLFVLIPWIPYQGEQAILLDVGAQKFQFFSVTLFPQDFTVLAAIFMAGAFALFFFTTWLGRVWCGFMCPQTIWMFMYVWVEQKVEGTRNQRIRRDKAPTDADKVKKKALKHSIWLLMSFLTATTFMTYFVPAKDLYVDLFMGEWSLLIWLWVAFFALCTYGNAGWLREKMCIYMCPYSRFQSAMFDEDTLIIAYDKKRGESRGRRKRKQDPKELGLGDCVDCNLCVEVCPAGIDIRNGLQYECISCGACIDACNQTMSTFNYPQGLIRFTSENSLNGKVTKMFRPKIIGYLVLLSAMFALMAWYLAARVPLEVNILRDRNTLYRENAQGDIENSYRLKIVNKTQVYQSYQMTVTGIDGVKVTLSAPLEAEGEEIVIVPFTLTVPYEAIDERMADLSLSVRASSNEDIVINKTTSFYSGK